MKNIPKFFLPAATALLLVSPLSAAPLFHDTFDVGTPTIGNDASDPNDLDWIAVSNVTPTIFNDSAGLGSGNALRGAPSNGVNLLVANFSNQNLASIGDSLSVSFDYRIYTGSAGARTPAFGLYTTNGTLTDYTDDKGYNLQLATTTQFRLQQDNDSDADNILTGSSDTQIGSAQTYSTYAGDERRFTLSITRVADTNSDSLDDIQLSYSVVDPTSTVAALNYSFVDTTPVSFVFDQFAIRSATGYMIDNVTGDYTAVPEPSAYALMLGGIASLMVLKRSRKSL